jgi:hypothetical protein
VRELEHRRCICAEHDLLVHRHDVRVVREPVLRRCTYVARELELRHDVSD